MATTAAAIIRGAFDVIGVVGGSQTLNAEQGADGLRRLNLMMRSLSIQDRSIPVTAREVFDLVAGQGGPTNPYTIGGSGTFDTARPPTQNSIVGAGLVLTDPDPDVEVPLSILTDAAWQAIQVKALTSAPGVPTAIYYNPTSVAGAGDDGLGRVYVWPVPSVGTNDLALYLRKPLGEFTALTTEYDLPAGCEEMIEYNLALRLCGPYSVPIDDVPGLQQMARSSMAVWKRSTYHLFDLSLDPAMTTDRRFGYDITTGNG